LRVPVDLGWFRLLVEIVRHGSLSAAARKQGLSQPAVSYQIRRLEAAFGVPLLHRQHRGVALTEDGKRVFEIAARTVSDIDDLAESFRADIKRPAIRLCTDYAFAALWLIPRMHAFRLLYPDFDIQIISTQRLAPDWTDEADIAVAFGTRAEFGQSGRMVMPERVVPVCSRSFLDRHGETGTDMLLSQGSLIHLDTALVSPWFDWKGYFAETGIRRQSEPGSGDVSFNNYTMVVQAALGGQGLALGWFGLIDSLTSGMLVAAGPDVGAADRGYWMLGSKSKHPDADRLAEWLMGEADAMTVLRGPT